MANNYIIKFIRLVMQSIHLGSLEAIAAPKLFSLVVIVATRGWGWGHTCVSKVWVLEVQYVATASLVRAEAYANLYVHIIALSVAVTQQG